MFSLLFSLPLLFFLSYHYFFINLFISVFYFLSLFVFFPALSLYISLSVSFLLFLSLFLGHTHPLALSRARTKIRRYSHATSNERPKPWLAHTHTQWNSLPLSLIHLGTPTQRRNKTLSLSLSHLNARIKCAEFKPLSKNSSTRRSSTQRGGWTRLRWGEFMRLNRWWGGDRRGCSPLSLSHSMLTLSPSPGHSRNSLKFYFRISWLLNAVNAVCLSDVARRDSDHRKSNKLRFFTF